MNELESENDSNDAVQIMNRENGSKRRYILFL